MGLLEKAITTQEEFDAAIGDRLKRERESSAKRYEGWKSPEDIKKLTDDFQAQLKKVTDDKDAEMKSLQDSLAKANQDAADKDKLIEDGAKYKSTLDKVRIAAAAGLDIKYADRLVGSNEEEWKADAEALAKDFGAAHRQTPPLGSPEPRPAPQTQKEIERNAFSSMLKNMEG